MESVVSYLTRLYSENKPNHVVEIGADPQMSLVARIGFNIPRISVVDFARCNAHRDGWLDMHRGMG